MHSTRIALALTLLLAVTAGAHVQDAPFSTPEEARAWLSKSGVKAEPVEFAILLQNTNDERTLFAVRALLLAGVSPKAPTVDDGLYPLTVLTRSCQGENQFLVPVTEALLDAGADPNQKEKADGGITALMQSVACPEVLVAMLRRKPDLNVTDDRGWTVAHHAFMSVDPPREMPLWSLVAHGFDFTRWTPSLSKEFRSVEDKELLSKLAKGLPGGAHVRE